MDYPLKPLDVLVVAPHPDDAELGMGGALQQFKQQSWQVGVLDLTDGEPTPHGSVEIRAQETQAATDMLQIDWRGNLGLTNRKLEATLEARYQLAEVIRQTRPKWLFAPYWIDGHPDHVAATQLVEAARFWAKLSKSEMAGNPHHPERLFYYHSVHLKLAIDPAFILDISEQWEVKMQALNCYQSQFVHGREEEGTSFLDRVRGQAEQWGQLIGRRYGEPYSCREPLGASSFSELI